MNKKIMILIMAIPLILLFSIFSIVNTASLAVDIPVSEVELRLLHEGEESEALTLDLANYLHPVYLISEVRPDNVPEANKKVNFSFEFLEEQEGSPETVLELVEEKIVYDGLERSVHRLVLKNVGKVKIKGSAGNYSDSVLVEVYSSKALAIASLAAVHVNGESVDFNDIAAGDILYFRANVHPDNVADKTVTWASSNENIIRIDPETGKARVLSSGQVTISATLRSGYPENHSRSVSINVRKPESVSGITIEGSEHLERNVSLLKRGSAVEFTVEIDIAQIEESYQFKRNTQGMIGEYFVVRYDQEKVTGHQFALLEVGAGYRKYSLILQLAEDLDSGAVEVLIRPNVVAEERDPEDISAWDWAKITMDFINPEDFTFLWQGFTGIVTKGTVVNYFVDAEPDYLEGIVFEFDYDRSLLLAQGAGSNSIRLYTRQAGTASITVSAKLLDSGFTSLLWSETRELRIIDPYVSLTLAQNAKTWGLADDFAFASHKLVLGNYQKAYLDLKTSLEGYKEGKKVTIEFAKLGWTSSDPSIATVENGVVNILGDGVVTITVYDLDSKALADLLGDPSKTVKATLKIRAVEGCNVYGYDELKTATKDGQKVVLHSNIMLGEDNVVLHEDGTFSVLADWKSLLSSQTFKTTADWTYYQNWGLPRPELYYIIEFKNDVYGNGYRLNAHYITTTYAQDSTKAAFLGPLNLVALNEYASVKAQDNVSFLIRTPGIIIDNVELAGCNDVADLTHLNPVGTTVEVMADEVYITNSYLKNGRTVLRVFGEYREEEHNYQTALAPVASESRDKPIHVHLVSSILSNAREFLLRAGTNERIPGDIGASTGREAFAKASPYLLKADGVSKYTNNNNPTDLANLEDEYFVNTYVKTYMRVKDCLFNNSGLFAIGIDSNFSGPTLDGLKYGPFDFKNDFKWENISGTSFVTVLKLEGEIKIHDWKNITHIDSSSLIEVGNDDTYSQLLNFNIADILQSLYRVANDPVLYSALSEYQVLLDMFMNVITPYGGVDQSGEQNHYVHGGIAFFGGGRNYSVLVTEENERTNLYGLKNYAVSIPEVRDLLSAAGYPNARLYDRLPYASGEEKFNFFMYSSDSVFGPDDQLTAPKTVKRCNIDELER